MTIAVALAVLAAFSSAATLPATGGTLLVARRRSFVIAAGVGLVGVAGHAGQGWSTARMPRPDQLTRAAGVVRAGVHQALILIGAAELAATVIALTRRPEASGDCVNCMCRCACRWSRPQMLKSQYDLPGAYVDRVA